MFVNTYRFSIIFENTFDPQTQPLKDNTKIYHFRLV